MKGFSYAFLQTQREALVPSFAKVAFCRRSKANITRAREAGTKLLAASQHDSEGNALLSFHIGTISYSPKERQITMVH